jgi:CDP-diacylglycerol---serine O-phosphatidyltransferase
MNTNKQRIFSIPNIITLLNVLAGCLSIVFTFNNNLFTGAILIFIASVFDFLDGLAARIFKSYSDLGKQLDSLADVISFGVAPSAILYQLFILSFQNDSVFRVEEASAQQFLMLCSAFLIALFSALRLAKFNIDTRQSDSFIGVPTPANAFFIASIPFVLSDYPNLQVYILKPIVLLPMIIVLSYLLISEIPLISLKFKNLRLTNNLSRYILLTISLLLLIFLRISAFPIIFVLYITISIIDNLAKQKNP